MKNKFLLFLIILFSFNASAKQQTLTLEVPTMNCITCPFTVKMALKRVEGVSNTEVSFKTKRAVVTFDDTKVNTSDLVNATTNAGYPSTVVNNVRE